MPATQPPAPSAPLRIEVISAGAGSGKTYTLTGRMVDMMRKGLRPAGIMATTFTQKAAAELQERVRVRLLECGMREAANDLGSALIGTVHSIGVRLLQRFAFEAGLSPLVEVIADGDSQRLFNASLAQVLSPQRIERMNALADRLGLSKKGVGEPFDWRRSIRDLTEVARSNNFSIETLKISKLRSWESFEQLLPPQQHTDPVSWNNRLLAAIDQTVAALQANEADDTKVTREATETLRNFQNQLKYRGELYWHEWVKIAKTKPGAKSKDLMADLQELALRHDEHPQFRADIKAYLDLVFDIAADALGEYEAYKKKRGLIDYTDMETSVSRLLRLPSVRATLAAELDLLLVDEFQDTSPIQLDIFLQISRLAKHSIWVGDPKQSIYGFRGAEPALMQAIIRATGGVRPENILQKSWRSRPDLVHAANAIFTRAFADMPPEQVLLEPAHAEPTPPQPGVGLALQHWHFRSAPDERKTPGQPWLENCIATQIATFLERKPLIFNKKRTEARPLQPGDIAVLCRNNKGCLNMAETLHRAGLKAAISRAGLLETEEARLVLACLKYLLTPSDALSVAEILLLTGGSDLEQMTNARLEWLQNPESGSDWRQSAFLDALHALRPRTSDLSASEILNLMLSELDIRRIAVQLGNPNQRLDNLDCLRRYALDYESACNRLHSAASLGGFLLWVDALADAAQDTQGSGAGDDAVKVLTYHRSKGLEYPVAICHDLNQPLKEQIWGLNLVAETDEPDLDDILGKRWLRFWVNPYADQLQGTRLLDTLQQTPAWQQATQTALAEEARLLYVGLTRARDYLVFPTAPQGTRWLNRVFNQGNQDTPTLDPDSSETPFYHAGLPLPCHTELAIMPKDFGEALPSETALLFHAPPKGRRLLPRPPQQVDVFAEWPQGLSLQLGEPRAFGAWLPFSGDYGPALGKALNGILCLDCQSFEAGTMLRAIQKQLQIRGVAEQLGPQDALRQNRDFWHYLHTQHGPQRVHNRYPLEAWQGKRQLQYQADLLLENEQEMLLLLFAGFAEGMKKWRQQAQQLTPLAYWGLFLLRQCWPHKTPRCAIVFPWEGQVCEVGF